MLVSPQMLYESGVGKSYLFISAACCNFITMIIILFLHLPINNSNGPTSSSKLNKKYGDKFDADTGSILDEKVYKEPGEGLHEDSGKKFNRDIWKKFSGESRKYLTEKPKVFQGNRNILGVDQTKSLSEDKDQVCVGEDPREKLGVNSHEEPSKNLEENSQKRTLKKPTEARYITKRLNTLAIVVDTNHGGVKTEETVALYQEDEINKTRPEKRTLTESSQGKERKTSCSLIRLMASGGFIWGVVFVGLCRFRLLLFLTTFLQFIANQPGADDDTAKAYSDIWGLVQSGSLFVGPLLGFVITAGKEKGRMRSACTSCFCVVTKMIKLVRTRKSGTRLTDAHVSHRVKEGLLFSEHAHKKKDLSSEPLVYQDDQDEEGMATLREIRGCLLSFSVNGFVLLAFGVSVLIPNVSTQVLSIVMLTLLRVFYNGSISNMLLAMFPKEHFGVLYAANCIAVVAVCTLQYPFFLVVENCFRGDMFWPNVILLIASVWCLGLPLYLWRYTKRLQASMLAPGFATESNPTRDRVQTEAFVDYEVYERLTVV